MAHDKIYVGGGCSESYIPRAEQFRFFESLNAIASEKIETFVICLDWTMDKKAEHALKYRNITFINVDRSTLKAVSPVGCLQHGAFIEDLAASFRLDHDDYVIYTDADLAVQRPFTDEEIRQLKQGFVMVGENWHEDETLHEEIQALGVQVPLYEIYRMFIDYDQLFCFNTGVLGMTVEDWLQLYKIYARKYPLVDRWMSHYAKQQWLICWILQTQGFRRFPHTSDLVRGIHVHGHEPNRAMRLTRAGVEKQGDTYVFQGKPIVFAHHML